MTDRAGHKGHSATVAVFGGTFDPVHYGHLRAALEAMEMLGLEELRMMPAGDPPHRADTLATAAQRLEMLQLAVRVCPGLRVDDREVRRSGPSFMVDTLTEIRGEIGEAPLLLLIGQDAANALDSWHRWRDLFGLAHLVVMRRPDAQEPKAGAGKRDSRLQCRGELRAELDQRRVDQVTRLHQSASGCVLTLEITQLDISSTFIRELIAGGRSPRFLMPEEVIGYILQRQLYVGG
jgi:nicotinate-nucleotide adenylyltransferase